MSPFTSSRLIETGGSDTFTLNQRRKIADADMDITPMIDITFLLLIFFLVATRMQSQGAVELPEARHGTSVSAKNSVALTVASGEGDAVYVFKGNGTNAQDRIRALDLAKQELEIVDYVQSQRTGPNPKEYVLIKAGKLVKHREIARLAKAVARVPGVALHFAVMEIE